MRHDGFNEFELGTVECSFGNCFLHLEPRIKVSFLLITLAINFINFRINMPCKTAVFVIDSSDLTPLQFRQMSG